MRICTVLALASLTPPAWGQIVDVGFDEITPPADVDLVVVRERAYGAGGVDLTAYGIVGVNDFVQSIYVRARHGVGSTKREVQGRLVFPAGITVLGVIVDGTDLGGSLDDGVLTGSDLVFAIGGDPDLYSGPSRGSELFGEAEHVCPRANGSVDFNLLMRHDDVDDFRVLIDYGTSFPAGLAFDVQLAVDGAVSGVITHELGVRVGDSGGAVFGSGDAGEVAGLTGIPLTAGAPLAVPNTGNVFDPLTGLLLNRVGGPLSFNHLERFDPIKGVYHTHSRKGLRSELARGPYGYVYGSISNFAGFGMLDLETGSFGAVAVTGLEGAISLVTGHAGGRSIVIAGHVSGVNSDFKVHLVDTITASVTSVVTLSQAAFTGAGGLAWEGGDAHVISSVGQYARIDFAAGTATFSTIPLVGPGSFVDLEIDATGTKLFALRQMNGSADASIYEIDVATSAVVPDALLTSLARSPRGLTRDANGHLWIVSRTFGLPSTGSLLEVDPATWSIVQVHECASKWDPNAILADVSPAPLGSSYCRPTVPNGSGRTGAVVALGSLDVGDNDFSVRAIDLRTNTFGFILNSRASGFAMMPGGSQGNLCLGGAVGRHDTQAMSSGGAGSFAVHIDLTSMPTPGGAVAVLPGDTWYFQCWHRQNPNTSNFTDAIQVTFQ